MHHDGRRVAGWQGRHVHNANEAVRRGRHTARRSIAKPAAQRSCRRGHLCRLPVQQHRHLQLRVWRGTAAVSVPPCVTCACHGVKQHGADAVTRRQFVRHAAATCARAATRCRSRYHEGGALVQPLSVHAALQQGSALASGAPRGVGTPPSGIQQCRGAMLRAPKRPGPAAAAKTRRPGAGGRARGSSGGGGGGGGGGGRRQGTRGHRHCRWRSS